MKPKLVQYYDRGLRAGYLIETGWKWARIQRILPPGSKQRPSLRIPIENLIKQIGPGIKAQSQGKLFTFRRKNENQGIHSRAI